MWAAHCGDRTQSGRERVGRRRRTRSGARVRSTGGVRQSIAGKGATVKSSLEIAQDHQMQPIVDIAAAAGLSEDEIELYGRYKAKIELSAIERLSDRPDAKIVNVTAITPTPAGEGKTTSSVALAQGLGHI